MTPSHPTPMSKSRKVKRSAQPPAPTASARRFPPWAIVLLAVAVLAAGGFWWSKQQHTEATAVVVPTATTNAANEPAPPTTPDPGFAKLKGNWLRPDGGYVLEIKSVEEGGKLDAAYANPRPIHVARAEASRKDGVVKVFVELRDVGYPGSTYDLAYEDGKDELTGIYYHAGLQQKFEVVFMRVK